MAKGASGFNSGSGKRISYSETKKAFDNYIKNANPADFIRAPKTITINGVRFENIDEDLGHTVDTIYGRDVEERKVENWYQSTRQADNGEWPIAKITVIYHKTKKRKKPYFYFSSGASGTGI